MSILHRLAELESSAQLYGYSPEVVSIQRYPPRQLWLTPGVREWCFPPGARNSDGVSEESLAYAVAQLDAFAMGKALIEDEDMKHLMPHSDEVWTIRTLLDPRVRIFGWFVAPRVFVAVHGKRRDQLERSGLGERWTKAMLKVTKARSELFGGTVIYHGNSFSDYV